MAYNEKLAARTREIISKTHKITEEKKMFGGLCFMVNHKMCVGVEQERMMVRLDPAVYDEVMEMEGCHPMDFTGKPMKGYVFVDAAVSTHRKNWLTGLGWHLIIMLLPGLLKRRNNHHYKR